MHTDLHTLSVLSHTSASSRPVPKQPAFNRKTSHIYTFTYLDHCTGHLFIVAARGQPAEERARDGIRRVQLVFMFERTREPRGEGYRPRTRHQHRHLFRPNSGPSYAAALASPHRQVEVASSSVARARVSVLLRAAERGKGKGQRGRGLEGASQSQSDAVRV